MPFSYHFVQQHFAANRLADAPNPQPARLQTLLPVQQQLRAGQTTYLYQQLQDAVLACLLAAAAAALAAVEVAPTARAVSLMCLCVDRVGARKAGKAVSV
jgi:hypothetical protein